ncbi:MAG: peptidylprolyl isomerase [candidate division WOR-3 bacterium]
MQSVKRLILIIPSLLIILGCSKAKQDKILAKVNGEPITASEFIKALPPRFPSETDEDDYRRSLIDQLINKKLIIQAAIKLGIDREIENAFAEDKKSILIQALYDDVVTKNVKISRNEIEKARSLLLTKVYLKQITVTDENIAQMIYNELNRGVNFDSLAKKYSQDFYAQVGGDVGFLPLLYLDSLVRNYVQKMQINEISMPIKSEDGYQIVQITDKQVDNDTSSSITQNAREFLEQEKSRILAQNYLNKLEQRLEFNPVGLQIFYKNYDEITDADGEIWVAKKDNQKVVYAKNLKHIAKEFPNLLDTAMRTYAVKRAIIDDLLYEDALARQLDKKPEVQRQLNERRDEWRYERFLYTQITEKIQITDDEVQAYYNANKEKYANNKLPTVAEQIRQQLFADRRAELYRQLIDSLKAQAKIEVFEPLVQNVGKKQKVKGSKQ